MGLLPANVSARFLLMQRFSVLFIVAALIPSIAMSQAPAGTGIDPGSVLILEVELLSVR